MTTNKDAYEATEELVSLADRLDEVARAFQITGNEGMRFVLSQWSFFVRDRCNTLQAYIEREV